MNATHSAIWSKRRHKSVLFAGLRELVSYIYIYPAKNAITIPCHVKDTSHGGTWFRD